MKRRLVYKLLLLLGIATMLQAETVDLNDLSGDWHLRVLDGHEVRKARAILDFKPEKMSIEGFDACNRISGKLTPIGNGSYKSRLKRTRMACRGNIHHYVSSRLIETIESGFTIKEETHYGIDGITIKSATHDLFFKRMGR
ncbi:MAG: META domain-containing protein [Sulfurovum sp.]|nr:META domain-containing protein [Sulfurovum sp.]